jgi:hypothetical protein
MASTISLPHIPFALGSSSLLDVIRSGAPRPFYSSSASSIPIFVLVFHCITFLFVCGFLVFWFFFFGFFFFFFFFAVSTNLFHASFAALRPLLGFFRAPTATSFHCALLPLYSSLYGVSVYVICFFPCSSFYLYSVLLLFFSLYFVCYLLVIMLLLRWFDWIPFDPNLCVVDVYVTWLSGRGGKMD